MTSNPNSTKQVIVIRKDLNMRKGKMVAQGSHASMAFLTKTLKPALRVPEFGMPHHVNPFSVHIENLGEVYHWLNNSFRKICVYVNSEEELKAVHEKALENGLFSHLIEDNGATEFNGVKTLTCCAIGPHYDSMFEGITDSLPLL
jgi:PTH2 family peptidyl-tRNA hydrolase